MYVWFLDDQFLERRLSHQCIPLHIFSGVYLSFSVFLFLCETDIWGSCLGCAVTACHDIVIDCFSTAFLQN